MTSLILFAILFLWVLVSSSNNGRRSSNVNRLKGDIKRMQKDIDALTDELKRQHELVYQIDNDLDELRQ